MKVLIPEDSLQKQVQLPCPAIPIAMQAAKLGQRSNAGFQS
jgi:hypothetical protein